MHDVRPLSLASKKGTNTTPGSTFSVMHAVALIDPALVEIFTSLWSWMWIFLASLELISTKSPADAGVDGVDFFETVTSVWKVGVFPKVKK